MRKQPTRCSPISSIQIGQVSQRSEFNWAPVPQSIFTAHNQMDQFLQSEIPDYDPRYEFDTHSDQTESYDHYFKDGFDDQLLNIDIPTGTTDYDTKVSIMKFFRLIWRV
uniref:Uncharacterized protein n=1 Tax=Glossina austeni TaxID=7395 RepID=A0A1A9VHS9_GLOAU